MTSSAGNERLFVNTQDNIEELTISIFNTGADPGFSFRGAPKIMCQHGHYER